jgi:hypothetical protein
VSDSRRSGAGQYVVTGAFGYSGKYITSRLLAAGKRVRTPTDSPQREHPFGTAVEPHPYSFDRPDELARSLQGAEVLINTYWGAVRPHGLHAQSGGPEPLAPILCCKAGRRRSSCPRQHHQSFCGVALALLPREGGTRGGVTGIRFVPCDPETHGPFWPEDILINNIAWMLRRFRVFGVFGDGNYKLQPIFVDDLAQLAVEAAASSQNLLRDAIGPETFTYRELVAVIGTAIGHERPILRVPPWFGVAVGRLLGAAVGDVVVTSEEVAGLMQNLLVTTSPPVGSTALSQWVLQHREALGRRYSNELARRRNRHKTYEDLCEGS